MREAASSDRPLGRREIFEIFEGTVSFHRKTADMCESHQLECELGAFVRVAEVHWCKSHQVFDVQTSAYNSEKNSIAIIGGGRRPYLP